MKIFFIYLKMKCVILKLFHWKQKSKFHPLPVGQKYQKNM